jgi:hypothetical protein
VPMPRYQLGEEEMAILISCLKTSSSHDSPGISDSGVRFATVMTDELGQEGRDATPALFAWLRRCQQQAGKAAQTVHHHVHHASCGTDLFFPNGG